MKISNHQGKPRPLFAHVKHANISILCRSVAFIIPLTFFFTPYLHAQQWKEKLIQITKLQVYTGYLQKGYDIIHGGLSWIGDLKQGDLDMHTDHFVSLMQVKSPIKNDPNVQAIQTMQSTILASAPSMYSMLAATGNFGKEELVYIRAVLDHLTEAVTRDQDELNKALANNTLQMQDNQRMDNIRHIYGEVLGQYQFFCEFTAAARRMGGQRAGEAAETITLKKYYSHE